MQYDEAAGEYIEGLKNLAVRQELDGAVQLGSYTSTLTGKAERIQLEVTPAQAALVLAHFRDTLRMAGMGRYDTLELRTPRK